jgi:hypothetical protein
MLFHDQYWVLLSYSGTLFLVVFLGGHLLISIIGLCQFHLFWESMVAMGNNTVVMGSNEWGTLVTIWTDSHRTSTTLV